MIFHKNKSIISDLTGFKNLLGLVKSTQTTHSPHLISSQQNNFIYTIISDKSIFFEVTANNK